MFPSAGYFKDVRCPFFDHGLCHRPYCHYSHTKQKNETSHPIATPPPQKPLVPSVPVDPKVPKDSPPLGVEKPSDIGEEGSDQITKPTVEANPTYGKPFPTEQDIFGSSSSDNEGGSGGLDSGVPSSNSPPEVIQETKDMVEEASPKEDIQSIQEKFREATKSVEKEKERETRSDKEPEHYENTGIKKKRVAHSNKTVVRDSGAAVTSLAKRKAVTDEKLKEALRDPEALYTGKKRKAWVPADSDESQVKKGTQSRPKLQVTINAKIPTKIRQRFLDSFIDEFIRMGVEPTESYRKSLEKEEALFTRSSSRVLYMNLGTHALRDLRKTVDSELKERKNRSNKRVQEHLDQGSASNEASLSNMTKGSEDDDDETPPTNKKQKKAEDARINETTEERVIPIKAIIGGSKDIPSVFSQTSSDVPESSICGSVNPKKFYKSEIKDPLPDDDSKCNVLSSPGDKEGSVVISAKKRKKKPNAKLSGLSFESALTMADKKINSKRTKSKEDPYTERGSDLIPTATFSGQSQPSLSTGLSTSDDTPLLSHDEKVCAGPSSKLREPRSSTASSDNNTEGNLINLSRLRGTDSSQREPYLKKPKRVIDQEPPKPAPSPSYSILSKKDIEFNAEVFYQSLQRYLLSEEQLEENGYPRPSDKVGMATIKREKIIEPTPVESLGSNAMRHRCCRCGQSFIIYDQGEYQSVEECVYHFGRLVKSKEYGEGLVSVYRCCGEPRGTPGCHVAMMHVTNGTLLPTESGYVTSPPPPSDEAYAPQVYGLDCEMVYTTLGLQLARITIVNMREETVFESLVKPSHVIVDYNTRFSGLTAKDFIDISTTLEDIHDRLRGGLVYSDTVLIGHSLESDLKSMKLIHSTVVDTALVFPHRRGLPYKRGLKELMVEQLQKFIQDNVDGGHDSREDALACMQLMIKKVKNDLQAQSRRNSK